MATKTASSEVLWRRKAESIRKILDKSEAKLGTLLRSCEQADMCLSTLNVSPTYVCVSPRWDKLLEVIGEREPTRTSHPDKAERVAAWSAWNARAGVIVRRWIEQATRLLQAKGEKVSWSGRGKHLVIQLRSL